MGIADEIRRLFVNTTRYPRSVTFRTDSVFRSEFTLERSIGGLESLLLGKYLPTRGSKFGIRYHSSWRRRHPATWPTDAVARFRGKWQSAESGKVVVVTENGIAD
jgi:hypothetical protein